MTAATAPTPLRASDRKAIAEIGAALTPEQRNKLAAMTRSHSRIILGKRKADGTLELQAMPHEQEGRRIAGTWTAYPRTSGGQYHRTLNYRLHTDGRRCGLGWGYCAGCTDLQADAPTAAQKAATRQAMEKDGGSALIPSTQTAAHAAQAAAKLAAKQAAKEARQQARYEAAQARQAIASSLADPGNDPRMQEAG